MKKEVVATDDSSVNLWLTPFDPEFNRNILLYHYTSFENACKILYGESLKFSSLSRSNDTIESKPKIRSTAKSKQQELSRLLNHFEEVNKSNIQLLCFSQDPSIDTKGIHIQNIYDDYTGRGFALPRMWAQYGGNNSGVCFILDKRKLLSLREKSKKYKKQIIYCDDVKYKFLFDSYVLTSNEIDELNDYFSNPNSVLDYEFLSENEKFIKQNYFSKSDDWSQEHEYRLLAYASSPLYINSLKEMLIGIVIGESMDNVNSKIIHSLSLGMCKEIKQIEFNHSGCTLKNLKYKGYDIYA